VKKPRVSKAKALTLAIQKVVNRNIETKYATLVRVDQQIANTLRTKFTGATISLNSLQSAMPPVGLGSQSNDQSGTRIKAVSLRTIVSINLTKDNLSTQDMFVRVFFLTSRNVKSYSVATSLAGGNLLRTGSATEEDWIPGGTTVTDPRALAHLNINRNAWQGSFKTFRLSKNQGPLNNGGTAGTVAVLGSGNASHTFAHDWKIQNKVLKYDESDNSSYPENFMPFIGFIAWYPDGTSVGQPDNTMPVNFTYTSHLYYKDG